MAGRKVLRNIGCNHNCPICTLNGPIWRRDQGICEAFLDAGILARCRPTDYKNFRANAAVAWLLATAETDASGLCTFLTH